MVIALQDGKDIQIFKEVIQFLSLNAKVQKLVNQMTNALNVNCLFHIPKKSFTQNLIVLVMTSSFNSIYFDVNNKLSNQKQLILFYCSVPLIIVALTTS